VPTQASGLCHPSDPEPAPAPDGAVEPPSQPGESAAGTVPGAGTPEKLTVEPILDGTAASAVLTQASGLCHQPAPAQIPEKLTVEPIFDSGTPVGRGSPTPPSAGPEVSPVGLGPGVETSGLPEGGVMRPAPNNGVVRPAPNNVTTGGWSGVCDAPGPAREHRGVEDSAPATQGRPVDNATDQPRLEPGLPHLHPTWRKPVRDVNPRPPEQRPGETWDAYRPRDG
jgi:hypothetical protein